MRRRVRSYRLTPAGGGMLLVAAAAVGVLAVGPASEQTPAAVVLIVILGMLVVQPGGTKAAWSRTLGERRALFGAQVRDGLESGIDDAELDGAWERERMRREREQLEREGLEREGLERERR